MSPSPALAFLVTAVALQAELPARVVASPRTDDAWIGAHPDRARDSLRIWIAATSSADPATTRSLLGRSESLARAWLRVWGDSFPLRDVRRFAALSPEHQTLRRRADSLRRAGNAALGSAGFEAALGYWRTSASVARSIADTAAFAATIGNIASGFYRIGEPDSARRYFVAAKDLARRVGDRRTMLNAIAGLASISKDAGELSDAAARYRSAIVMRRQIGDYRGIAADANNLGLLATELGDEAEAHRRHTEALVTAREHGLDEPAAAALVNLGALATDAGDLALAERRYGEALALYRKLGDREYEALALYDQGMLESARGNYPKAADRYRDAAAALDAVGSWRAVSVRSDLAVVLAASGRIEEAERALRSAEATARSTALGRAPHGRLQLVRGTLAVQLNRLRPARAAYAAALAEFRAAGDTAGTAEALAALGELSLLEENHPAARAHLSKAATLHERLGDRRSASLARLGAAEAAREAGDTAFAARTVAAAVADLRAEGDAIGEAWATCQEGDHHRLAGAAAAAETRYRRGLARLGRRPVPAVAACLYSGLGAALRMRRATSMAIAELGRGIAVIEGTATGMATPARRADYLSDKWSLYADLALAQRAAGDNAAAFVTSERLRAREMAEVLAGVQKPAAPRRESPRVAALRNRITGLLHVPGGSRSAAALRGEDEALNRLSDDRRQALARAYDAYAALLDSTAVSPAASNVQVPAWRDVAGRLPAGSAFIEYLVTDSASLAFVVTPARLSVIDLPATGRELAADAEFLRAALARGADVRAALRRLNARLVAPVERAGLLGGVRSLIVVPHRELHYVPFSALLEAEPSGRHLVERYEITHAASAATALELASRPATRRAARILALAPHTRILPGTAAEVAAISRIYGSDATVLAGPRATREALIGAASDYSIIHLATLGVLNKHDPRFSFVQLAPARGSDGRLEAHDVAALSLQTSLVVLGACQTALGSGRLSDVPPGDDWVGLVQAFHTAGAARVVGTLWPVEDRATSVLMSHFYRELRAGRSAQAALTAAQRALLGDTRTRSPFYWAGFLLHGSL